MSRVGWADAGIIDFSRFLAIFQEKMKFFGETFAQFKKTFYLCIAFQGKHLTREAGSNFQTPHERGWKK